MRFVVDNFGIWLTRLNFWQFDLVEKKELAPLDELNDAILAENKGR
jgi:hypothetical protein